MPGGGPGEFPWGARGIPLKAQGNLPEGPGESPWGTRWGRLWYQESAPVPSRPDQPGVLRVQAPGHHRLVDCCCEDRCIRIYTGTFSLARCPSCAAQLDGLDLAQGSVESSDSCGLVLVLARRGVRVRHNVPDLWSLCASDARVLLVSVTSRCCI